MTVELGRLFIGVKGVYGGEGEMGWYWLMRSQALVKIGFILSGKSPLKPWMQPNLPVSESKDTGAKK